MKRLQEATFRSNWACALVGCLLTACASESGDSSFAPRGGASFDAGAPGAKLGPGGSFGLSDGGVNPLPPEREEQRSFEAPQAGARFVYVANAQRDTVAIIDSKSLAIRTVQVGDTPNFLATVPGTDVALVINQGSEDVNILRTDAEGVTAVSRLPVVPGANHLSVARDGAHAVAWFDSSRRDRGARGNFQEVSVISLAPGADSAVPMTVGFRPSGVVFADHGSAAFVITEDGISVIRFADVKGPAVAPFVRVASLGADMPQPLDVAVTPDGRFAVARQEGAARVILVDIGKGTVSSIDLGAQVTDLDLAPSGAFALAVVRAENAIVRIEVPGGFTDEGARVKQRFEGEIVGSASLSPDGKLAVLYTTAAVPAVERLVVADLTSAAEPVLVRLKKAVRAVAVAPDGKSAVVLHTKLTGDPAMAPDVETEIDRSCGYTVVDLRNGFAKLQLTPADVSTMAITPDGGHAFLAVRDPGPTTVRLVQRIALGSFIVDDFQLGSPPVAVGVLGQDTRRVFISQEHPEGRISFIDWDTRDVQSVTGFELNGRIVQ